MSQSKKLTIEQIEERLDSLADKVTAAIRGIQKEAEYLLEPLSEEIYELSNAVARLPQPTEEE